MNFSTEEEQKVYSFLNDSRLRPFDFEQEAYSELIEKNIDIFLKKEYSREEIIVQNVIRIRTFPDYNRDYEDYPHTYDILSLMSSIASLHNIVYIGKNFSLSSLSKSNPSVENTKTQNESIIQLNSKIENYQSFIYQTLKNKNFHTSCNSRDCDTNNFTFYLYK